MDTLPRLMNETEFCIADPLWRKLITGEDRDRSRLLAAIGVVTTACGVAVSSVIYIPSLQMVLYGLIGGEYNYSVIHNYI